MSLGEEFGRRLADGDVLIVDGGMGSELDARGVPMDGVETWCAMANLDHFDAVRGVHVDFIRAGADVIITNTYTSARFCLVQGGVGDRTVEINRRAVEAAIEARDEVADRPVYIAGSVSPYGIWSTPDKSKAALANAFTEQATTLAEAGADLIVLECFHPTWEAGLTAALDTGLPVWVTWVADQREDGKIGPLWDPTSPVEMTVEELMRDVDGPQVAAMGVMHTPNDMALKTLDVLKESSPKPYGAYPHWGEWNPPPHWEFADITPAQFAAAGMEWLDRGAQLLGGCCGIRPDHIAALTESVAGTSARA